jgi:hypothetical protein
MEAYLGEKEVFCVCGKEKEENENVRKRLLFTCGNVLFMGKMCANKSKEVVCNKYL